MSSLCHFAAEWNRLCSARLVLLQRLGFEEDALDSRIVRPYAFFDFVDSAFQVARSKIVCKAHIGNQQDFVRTARAKGLSRRVVVLRHALGNALLPIITVVGLDFGSYLTGSILTETIFSWPGVGRYVLTAISKRDLPAIQGSILFLSLIFVLVNLLTDLAYAKADPRVAYD